MLEDKVVVITGAGKGLGKVLAHLLSSKKVKLIISDIDKKTLEETAKETGAISIITNTTNQIDVQDLASEVISKFKKIDIWINNAGVWLPRMNIEEVPVKRIHDLFEVNFFGTLHGTLAALSQMKKQKDGTIVNIISTSALQARPQSAAYCASKHAIKGLTDSVRDEIKDFNIKVIGIYPGGMKTMLFEEKKPNDYDEFMTPESVAEKIIENLEKETPLNELIIKREGQK